MKSIVKIVRRIHFALEFANVSNIESLKEILDRHESRIGKNASPNSSGAQGNRGIRMDNVHYLSTSSPAR